MKVKGIVTERFQDYKYPSYFIAFPTCTFKCEKECGMRVCQNSRLAIAPVKEIDVKDIVDEYLSDPITHAIVCGGLEPMDSFEDLLSLVKELRENRGCMDDIVVYTGYYKPEIELQIQVLSKYKNIVVKFGRFVPNKYSHFDPVLQVTLANEEQYAERIS